MDTQIIDRLFLELSQVTNATTQKELALLKRVRDMEARKNDACRERDRAEAEVERFKAQVSRLYACRDELRDVTEAMDDPAINNTVSLVEAVRALKAERDKAQGEVKRLTDAGNHSASLNSSRPSDEDI